MSHRSLPARLSRSSARYSPYSRSPFAHPSPSSSNQDSPCLSGDHEASHPSNAYLSPSAHHIHPSTSNTPVIPSVRSSAGPSLTLQADAAQPSSSTLQLERSHYHDNMVDPQSQQCAFVHLHHPSTNVPFPDPTFFDYHQPNHQHVHRLMVGPTATQHSPVYQGEGIFSGSQNFSVRDSTFIDNSTTSDSFMKDFLEHTIIGAEYDSSDRDPPPRCHPGTRLAILGRCKAFIDGCNGEERMRWVVGCAGVGKSALMQMVAEETPADASVFLSVNGRHDGTKIFTTIAYQLAVKYKSYRQFIQNEISRDPSLFRKALSVQFQKFIADPFIHRQVFDRSRRFVIIIDGLDECNDPLVQEQLLELISRFCISCPTSPVTWFIASRPEAHITSFFEKVDVQPAYTKEEMAIDSDEACEDVQRYLRDELKKIKLAYPTLRRKREWPSELEFTKIATAAGGLFAYASIVVRYINDLHFGDPVSQLGDVLAAIDKGLNDESSRKNNPLALLDALYARIISKIPDVSVINAKKILLFCSKFKARGRCGFRTQCNILGLTEDTAYAALRHLHAVMKVPAPDKVDDEELTFYHKSFEDFLFDPLRSQFCSGRGDVEMLEAQYSSRIVEQVPANFDCMDLGESIECAFHGYLTASASICNISLSWPEDERFYLADDKLRRQLYAIAMEEICCDFRPSNKFFWKMSYFNHLTTRFTALHDQFPFLSLLNFVFDEVRTELTDLGKLKQVPAWSLDYASICTNVSIQLTCPVGMNDDLWSQDCAHKTFTRMDEGDLQDRQCLGHRFLRMLDGGVLQSDIPRFNIKAIKDSHSLVDFSPGRYGCFHCSQRLARHLISNPDELATVFVDATEMCYVEWSFVDPDSDGLLEWRYRFCHSGLPNTLTNA